MTSLSFAQLSDIHLSSLGDHHDLLSGHSGRFLSEVVADLNQVEDLDFVLLTGDLLDTADQQEFNHFQQIIQTLTKPYYVIPGNHDRRELQSVTGLTRHQFAHYFNPQVAARPTHDPTAQIGHWSLTIKPEIQLIGLDSIRDENWGGIIDAAQVEWLKNELAIHADKLIIVAVHHPFHALAPIDDHPDWRNFVCDHGPEMLALLDAHPAVKIVLTGHHHQTKADSFGRRLHLACPALAGYPCAYRRLRLTQPVAGEWQIEWQTLPVTTSATLALAQERMRQAWLAAGFESDFVEAHIQLAWGSAYDQHGIAKF